MTFKEHQDNILHLMGDFHGGTREKVKRWLNTAYSILWEQTYGLYKEEVDYLTTSAAYTTGTVAITQGQTAVTGDSTVWDTTWSRRYIQIAGTDPWYRVASFTTTTALVLDDAYLGDTQTEATYKMHTYLWPLPAGVDRVIMAIAELDEAVRPLDLVDRASLLKDWSRPLEWDTGTPEYAWVDEKDPNGVHYLGIWPPPTSASLVQVRFETSVTDLSADDDTVQIDGADGALQAAAKVDAMTYKGRIRESGFWRQVYENERDKLLLTVVRATGTQFRHKDPTDATSQGRGINLGAQFPRRW